MQKRSRVLNNFKTRLCRIVVIDVALALLILLGILFSARSSADRAMRYVLLANTEQVSTVIIDTDSRLELRRTQDAWILLREGARLPADGARVEAFLKAVSSVTRLEPVARDKASWAKLGLEGESARTISLLDDKGTLLSEFTVGNYAQSPGLVYMAPSGGSAAYAAASGFASYAMGTPASWLNLSVWSNAPSLETVQELVCSGTIINTDGSIRQFDYTVSRAGSGWIHDGVALDSSRVEAAIRSLAALRGDDYLSPEEPRGQSTLRMQLRLGNGRSLSLDIEEPRTDGRYPVLSSQRDARLYLPSWAVRESFKTLEELMPQPSP